MGYSTGQLRRTMYLHNLDLNSYEDYCEIAFWHEQLKTGDEFLDDIETAVVKSSVASVDSGVEWRFGEGNSGQNQEFPLHFTLDGLMRGRDEGFYNEMAKLGYVLYNEPVPEINVALNGESTILAIRPKNCKYSSALDNGITDDTRQFEIHQKIREANKNVVCPENKKEV